MRGPIDYIIVGFEGNKFKGEILKELESAADSGVIAVLALALISKNEKGSLASVSLSDLDDQTVMRFTKQPGYSQKLVTEDDIKEVGDLLENNTSAGFLVIEQLWAKPLKKAILNANGVLVAEGRIHPQASQELELQGAK